MDIRRLVGANVRRIRQQRGFSQEVLGFDAGLDRTYVSGVERGLRNPTVIVLGKIAKALAVSPAELLKSPKKR